MGKFIAIGAIIFAIVIGAWLGLNQTKQVLGNADAVSNSFALAPNNWLYSELVGTPAASALVRAKIAISGPLALAASETIYFLAIEDIEGNALNSSCTYRLSGNAFDARWWSVAIYDGLSHQYIPNSDNRSSWNNVALPQEPDGRWQITIAPLASSGSWLPAQTEANQPFELLLRLYNPSAAVRAAAPNILLPKITRVTC